MTSPHSHSDSSSWAMIDVVVSFSDSEIIADYLWSRGVAAVEVLPSTDHDHEILRTSVGDQPETFIASLCEDFPHIRATVAHVDKSISETWRQYASPTWINDDVVIVPEWIHTPQAEHVLRIEPLDTFGLGNHPTTVLAFRLALQHIAPSSDVFDLGTGSGVLAVGLAKILHCNVAAFDIAPSSQQALHINAVLNAVTTCSWTNSYPTQKVDAVVANILAPVLIQEADAIQQCLKHGGTVILSGMREDQTSTVVSKYTHCVEIDRIERDGWFAIALRKSS